MVGADLCVCPGLGLHMNTGADTQVCPYVEKNYAETTFKDIHRQRTGDHARDLGARRGHRQRDSGGLARRTPLQQRADNHPRARTQRPPDPSRRRQSARLPRQSQTGEGPTARAEPFDRTGLRRFGGGDGFAPGRNGRSDRRRLERGPRANGRARAGEQNCGGETQKSPKGRTEMNALTNPFVTASAKGAAWMLVWSWQAAVLLACVLAGLKICRVKSPALRHQIGRASCRERV